MERCERKSSSRMTERFREWHFRKKTLSQEMKWIYPFNKEIFIKTTLALQTFYEVSTHICQIFCKTYGKFLIFPFTSISVNMLCPITTDSLLSNSNTTKGWVSHLGKKNAVNNDVLWKLLCQWRTLKYTNRYI